MTETVSGKYRLVWFQHLHKAAGTSIVQLALANGERTWAHHVNGNPYTGDGDLIRIWQQSPADQIRFVDQCEASGVTFVATEWGLPDVAALAADPRVVLITCFREPLDRFVSDFYYSLHNNFSHSRASMAGAVGTTFPRSSNYYCRLFAGRRSAADPLDQPDLDAARRCLASFDCAFAIEGDPELQLLKQRLQWSGPVPRVNEARRRARRLLRALKNGRVRAAWNQLRHPKRPAPDPFARRFREWNALDYRLYSDVMDRTNSLLQDPAPGSDELHHP